MADTTFSSYNLTAPGFWGNAFTSNQRKVFTDNDAQIRSGTVGGNYQVDAVLTGWNINLPLGGTVRVNDGTWANLWNAVHSGNYVRIKFTNDWNTPVAVQSVLLLDEPFNALDEASRASIHALLMELSAAGRTIVFTSHHHQDVAALAQRVVRIESGRIVRQD